jgi:predicted phosphodiesterase
VLNGDIAAGPLPGATLERLMALGERAVWVNGNADRWLVEAYDGGAASLPAGHPAGDLVAWCAAQLTRAQRDRLAALPLTVTLEAEGLGPVTFCHASARDDMEVVLVDSPLARWAELFAGVDTGTVVLGHTHMPFDRLADRRRFVNAGSVGMPYGHRGASWALLGGGSVQLRRTAYDVEAAAAHLRTSTWSGVDAWIDEYLTGSYSDADALAAFTPMAAAG